ncbi:MAG: short-chain fatty acid transporter [Nitrospirae bacterium]|nr:short-chain fatty acid transporter [Nitrospirota bacterium]
MLAKLAEALTRWSTRWVPDSFVIVFILTLLVFGLAKGLTPSSWSALVQGWGDGLWALLAFSAQMCLIMIAGHLLASTPVFKLILGRLASWPKGPRSAIFLVALTSMLLALLNWGLSLIGSAVLVREVARHRRDTDYRLMVASGYLGLGAVWHAGFSGSAPLLVATSDHFLAKQIGVIPITQTTLSPFNLTLTLAVLVVLSLAGILLHPRSTVPGAPVEARTESGSDATAAPPRTPAERLERSPWVTRCLAVLGVGYLVIIFVNKGPNAIDLNTVILILLVLSLWLHRSTKRFLSEAEEGTRAIWGVLIQFPLYSGIFGVIKSSGLQDVLADAFVALSSPERFPFLTLVYSGVLNYFVPSGGAKFAIEAPYIMEAAQRLGVEYPRTILAYAWGDTLTDIIQPFWAIPLLGFAKVEFREIMGYCLLYFFIYAPLVMAAFYFWG